MYQKLAPVEPYLCRYIDPGALTAALWNIHHKNTTCKITACHEYPQHVHDGLCHNDTLQSNSPAISQTAMNCVSSVSTSAPSMGSCGRLVASVSLMYCTDSRCRVSCLDTNLQDKHVAVLVILIPWQQTHMDACSRCLLLAASPATQYHP